MTSVRTDESTSVQGLRVAVDHLVVAGPDLDDAIEYVENLLGVPMQAGGAHPGRGTRNALLGLGRGCYLEAIGRDLEQPEPPAPRPFGIDHLDAPRLVSWAVRARNLPGVIADFAHASFGPAQAMSRRLEDGTLLAWELAFPRLDRKQNGSELVPFLIDWGATSSPGVTLESRVLIESVQVSGGGVACAEAIRAGLVTKHGVSVQLAAALVESEWKDFEQGDKAPRLTALIECPGGVRELSS